MVRKYYNYVNGRWIKVAKGKFKQINNPGNLDDVIGLVQYADSGLAKSAMDSAQKGYELWSRVTLKKRISLLNKALNQIKKNKNEFAEIITRENGKTITESLSEINSSISEGKYQLKIF